MRGLRESVLSGKFPQFVRQFMKQLHPDQAYEQWAVDALRSVNIDLTADQNS